MRDRIFRVVLLVLVVALVVTMAAAMVFDLYGVRSHGVQIRAARDAPPRKAVEQLQFGVPAPPPRGQ